MLAAFDFAADGQPEMPGRHDGIWLLGERVGLDTPETKQANIWRLWAGGHRNSNHCK